MEFSQTSTTWLQVKLIDVTALNMGQSPSSADVNDAGDGIAFFQGKAEFGKLHPTARKFCTAPKKIAESGDILLSVRAPVGPTNVANQKTAIGRGLAAIRADTIAINPGFLLHYFRFIEPWMSQQGTGTTFKAISGAFLKELNTVLPPLAEQEVIADKLDALLAQVENTKARLERIPQILKRFRQSVLAAAVSGRLTEEWRKNLDCDSRFYQRKMELPSEVVRGGKQKIKGVLDLSKAWLPGLPKGWIYRTVDQLYQTNHIFEYVDGNHGSLYPRKEDFSEEGVLFLTASQIGDSSDVNWGAVPRLRHNKAKNLVKGWTKAGDVLLTHNATVGRTAIIADNFSEESLLGTSVTLYRTSDSNIIRKYLYYFFSSRAWQSQLEAVMEQSTRNQVSITKQALMFIALPPLNEQTEIVRRVDQLFAHADRIEQQVNHALARFNNLTQSILAKAFRGELTEQWRKDNPELISGENSAEALLERIKAERAAMKPAKKSRKRRASA